MSYGHAARKGSLTWAGQGLASSSGQPRSLIVGGSILGSLSLDLIVLNFLGPHLMGFDLLNSPPVMDWAIAPNCSAAEGC